MDAWVAEQWIEDRLQADATLISLGVAARVYRYVAPPAAVMPFIVLAMQPGGADVVGLGISRILSDLAFTVRVTGSFDQMATMISIAQRFDPALQVRESNGVGCVRTNPVSYGTTEDGQYLRHLGGIYRLVG